MDLLVPLAGLAIMCVILGLIGFLATLKGFAFKNWFFSGILGLIVLLFLPSASAKGISDIEKGHRAGRGNLVGKWLSVLFILITCIRIASGYNQQGSRVSQNTEFDAQEIRSVE